VADGTGTQLHLAQQECVLDHLRGSYVPAVEMRDEALAARRMHCMTHELAVRSSAGGHLIAARRYPPAATLLSGRPGRPRR
jgi:hypothetical protein